MKKDPIVIKNIMIVGCAGTGKSTLAMQLSQKTGFKIIHMDHMYWESGWVKREQEIMNAMILKEVEQDGWICEGNNSASYPIRVPLTHMIIWLDFPRYTCMWRVLLRLFKCKYMGWARPDVPDGCEERFDWEFMKWVWEYNKKGRLRIERLFQETKGSLGQVHLKSSKDVADFVNSWGARFTSDTR